jgi:cysteine desulfurase
MTDAIYLDYNATTPVDPRVVAAMLPYFTTRYGNPSSSHAQGREARDAVSRARAQVAALLGAVPEEIVFTGGGSEASNTVFKGLGAPPSLAICMSAVEHPATTVPVRTLEAAGAEVHVLAVDGEGRTSSQFDFGSCFADAETGLLTIMHANNEVGTVQPVAELAAAAHDAGGVVHVDAAQSVGKLRVRVDDLGADYVSIAAHKFYGPKGVGALYVRNGRPLSPLIEGASHESGRRAGTENVPLIVGLGVAAELAGTDLEAHAQHAKLRVEEMWEWLRAHASPVCRHAAGAETLPNTLSVAFEGVDASVLLERVGDRLAVSLGAACHADGTVSSPVLNARGLREALARGTVRISVGRATTPEEIERAAFLLAGEVSALR